MINTKNRKTIKKVLKVVVLVLINSMQVVLRFGDDNKATNTWSAPLASQITA